MLPVPHRSQDRTFAWTGLMAPWSLGAALVLSVAGCGAESTCAMDLSVHPVDGASSSISTCASASIDDAESFTQREGSPELRSFTVHLQGIERAGGLCAIRVVQQGVCGAAYYEVGHDGSGSLASLHCEGMVGAENAKVDASSGFVRLLRVEGSESSDAGGPLDVTLEGELALTFPGGLEVEGSFSVRAPAQAQATASSVCLGTAAPPALAAALVADAGLDLTVEPFTVVDLDASGSYHPNGERLRYTWTLVSKPVGSTATISNATFADAQVFVDLVGVYELSLGASDGRESAVDTLQVVVEEAGSLP